MYYVLIDNVDNVQTQENFISGLGLRLKGQSQGFDMLDKLVGRTPRAFMISPLRIQALVL